MLDYQFVLTDPDGTEHDITERVSRDGLSTLTVAVERNLHEFRAGDITLTLDDGDGYFAGLFDGIASTSRWRLRAVRDGVTYFSGAILPVDSILFDKKQGLVEVTALDLSKLLEDIPSDTVARDPNAYALTAQGNPGNTTLTLASTAALFNGDQLRLTDADTTEEVEIELVLSATQIRISVALANTFPTTSDVLLITPFFRYKTPSFLINALIDAAGSIPSGRNVLLSSVQVSSPVYSEINTNLLNATTVPTAMVQKDGKHLTVLGASSFEQQNPEDDWSVAGGTSRTWADWGPYRTQAEGEPATLCTLPAPSLANDPDLWGFDYTVGAFIGYLVHRDQSPGNLKFCQLIPYTSADGFTWAAGAGVTLGDATVGAGSTMVGECGDYDPVRGLVYYAWKDNGGDFEFGFYDVNAAVKTVLDTTGDRATGGVVGGDFVVYNIRYSREFDGVLVYNFTTRKMECWRGSTLLWARAPKNVASIKVKQIRFFSGAFHSIGWIAGVPSLLTSSDEFTTLRSAPLSGAVTGSVGGRLRIINGSVRIALTAASPRFGTAYTRYFAGSTALAGLISYADFSDESLINAIDDLAILLNAVFYMDSEDVANFIQRDLDSGSPEVAIDDLVLEREDSPSWLETYDYVEVKTGDQVATAGQKTSISRNLSVDVQLAGSLELAASSAGYLLEFYGKNRRVSKVHLEDDGTAYRLLDPVSLDGVSWLVYSVERDLSNYEVSMELLEKVA